MSFRFDIRTSSGVLRFPSDLAYYRHLDSDSSGRNTELIRLFVRSYLTLLSDSPLNARFDKSATPVRVYKKFFKTLTSGDLLATIKRFQSLSHTIVSSTRLKWGDYALTGDFCAGMKDTPIFKEYLIWHRTGDPKLLRYIYTFLLFGKKMDYVDESLDAVALRGWQGVEERLTNLELPEAICADLKVIVEAVIGNSFDAPFRPRFGPGAVSEKSVRGKISKSNQLRYHPRLDRTLFGLPGLFGRTEERRFQKEWLLPDPDLWNKTAMWSSDESEFRLVPKDISKSRSICMEPNSFMWAQQGVLDQLLARLRDSETARSFISIQDQAPNRVLAEYGSYSGSVDTIDLSAASDSVSVDLVRRVFSREMLFFLLGTRTNKVRLPTGEVVQVKKFAPMGSAVCFPTQCIIFTSLVIYSAMRQQGHCSTEPEDVRFSLGGRYLTPADVRDFVRHRFRRSPGRVYNEEHSFEPGRVYGDDIIVDRRITPFLVPLLTRLGFSVNTDKSFTDRQAFRESCGGFYWNGYDVTPLYFRVKRYQGHIGPDSVASMIALANHAGDSGYFGLRSVLIQTLLRSRLAGMGPVNGLNPIAFVSDRAFAYGIYSRKPRNSHLRKRYQQSSKLTEVSYQRDEFHCIMLTSAKRRHPTEGESSSYERYLYVRWWDTRSEEIELLSLGVPHYDSGGSRLVRRWMPDQS